ncbi:MAG: DUF2461 domain-containing protein [Spirochaetes bacterium]|nr:DUF2461 domain-containing protein [Spirochaetota bacterium]
MPESYITPELFEFFRKLEKNNNKAWFEKNKDRFEKIVREPLLEFIDDFGVRLPQFAPHYIADPRKSGGSLFRIYRDVRFSKDKTPYKTAAGIQFRHEQGKDVHAPGYYIHLEPGSVFCGIGIWRPDSQTVGKIRTAIDKKQKEWLSVKNDKSFSKIYSLGGDSLKRAPKGFDPKHPLIEDIKRKDFVASITLTEEDTCSRDFINKIEKLFKSAEPMMKFLTEAVGLPW